MTERNMSRLYEPVFKAEAIYFDKDSLHEVKAFIGADRSCGAPVIVHNAHMGNPALYIHGYYGTQIVPMGNWLVRWISGEYAPFRKEHFNSMFMESYHV